MNEYLLKYYNFLKNNLAMLAIAPTVLGGVWQLTKLVTISTNMIRFFSISQLVSDGLLILLVTFVPLLFLLYPFLRPDDEVSDTEDHFHLPDVVTLHVLFTILVVAVILFIGISYKLFDFVTIDNPISLANWTNAISLLFGFGYLTFRRYISIDRLAEQLCYNVYVVIICVVMVLSLNNISKNLSGIENFEKLIGKIEKANNYSKTPEIIYFNDKYIFIEIEKKKRKLILIKQVEDLFAE